MNRGRRQVAPAITAALPKHLKVMADGGVGPQTVKVTRTRLKADTFSARLSALDGGDLRFWVRRRCIPAQLGAPSREAKCWLCGWKDLLHFVIASMGKSSALDGITRGAWISGKE